MAIPTANLVLDIQAGVGVTKTGNEIDTIADQSGNGNDCTGETNNTSNPIDTVDASGQPVIRFLWDYDTAHPQGYLEIPVSFSGMDTNSFSVYIVATQYAYEPSSLISFGSYASGVVKTRAVGSAACHLYLSLWTTASPIYTPVNKSVYAGIASGSGGVLRLNDTRGTTDTIGQLTGISGGSIGRYKNGNSEFFSGDIYRVLVYNTPHNQATEDAIVAELASLYSVRLSYDKLIVFEGDSRTQGYKSTNNQGYVAQAVNVARNSDWLAYNVSTPGHRVDEMQSSYAAQVAPLYQAGFSRNVFTVLGGTNDLVAGANAATIFSRLTGLCGSAKSTGFETAVHTELARGATPNATLSSVNTSLRGGDSSIDTLLDVGLGSSASPRLDDATNTTYFDADELHLKNAGSLVLADALSVNVLSDGSGGNFILGSGIGGYILGA